MYHFHWSHPWLQSQAKVIKSIGTLVTASFPKVKPRSCEFKPYALLCLVVISFVKLKADIVPVSTNARDGCCA